METPGFYAIYPSHIKNWSTKKNCYRGQMKWGYVAHHRANIFQTDRIELDGNKAAIVYLRQKWISLCGVYGKFIMKKSVVFG